MIAKDLAQTFTRNWIRALGAVMATIAGSVTVAFFVLDLLGFHGGPYLGILAFAVLPAMLVLGLVLIPIGNFVARRQRRKAEKLGIGPPRPLVVDFSKPVVRAMALFVLVMTAVNVAIIAGGTYKAVEVMDSTEFCGTSCHVMKPELTAYSYSPHAHVGCVGCHIGSGASWFVKSKLSGTRQLFAVAFNTFSRPIATPVHDLRPARETCENCHWPARFTGDRLKILTNYTDDEKTEPRKTVLLMNIGGTKAGKPVGIHWHVAPENRVRYFADPNRRTIAEVELADVGGIVKKRWKLNSEAAAKTQTAGYEWREMDCVDCHNRPTHAYGEPKTEVDAALLAGRIDADLPYVRREAVRVVQGQYTSDAEARRQIPAQLAGFYAEKYPEVAKTKAESIQKSGQAIADIFAANVFPEMKIAWGTYPSYANHHGDSGCFRCHSDTLVDDKGKKIAKSCDGKCHTPLETESKKPEILELLYPSE